MRQIRRPLQGIAIYSAILSQLVGSVLIGIYAGMWMDRRYDTAPVFLVICLLAGLAIGVLALITTIRKYDSGD